MARTSSGKRWSNALFVNSSVLLVIFGSISALLCAVSEKGIRPRPMKVSSFYSIAFLPRVSVSRDGSGRSRPVNSSTTSLMSLLITLLSLLDGPKARVGKLRSQLIAPSEPT